MLLSPSSLNSFCTCNTHGLADHVIIFRVVEFLQWVPSQTLIPISSYLSFTTMVVAINTAHLALHFIPRAQEKLDRATGGQRRLQIHRFSAYATLPLQDSEIWRQSHSVLRGPANFDVSVAKPEPLEWQADPDDDLGDAEVLHHLHQQAATIPLLSSVISQSDHSNAATTVTGSALSASINAKTQGRLLSSFHRYSLRESGLGPWTSNSGSHALTSSCNGTTLFPLDLCEQELGILNSSYALIHDLHEFIVWAESPRDNQFVFWQIQLDVVDLFSWRALPTFRPGKRRRTAFNQFLQVSDSPVVEDTSRRNPHSHARRFNGVRHRHDRRTWVAEMKPHKHKNKQDFGNFKSEVEAVRAVDAAFHHYGKPERLNFPDTSLQFLSMRPTAPPGLDEKAKVKFVKEEAKLLLAAMAATSPLQSTHTNSLQIPGSPRRSPSGYFRSLSEISWPFSCSGLDEVDDAFCQPQQRVDLDSICDISTIGVQTNSETLDSEQISAQGWDWTEESMLAASANVVNPCACESRNQWLDSLIRSPPASMHSRSPSPSRFQDEIAQALLEYQSFSA